MAAPRAFISFDFDNDKTIRDFFVGQARNSKTPFEIQDWSSKEALPQAQWENIINDKIARCHFSVVLIGRSAATASGISKEINMAVKNNVPFFGVYVDGAGTSTPLPAGLARNRVTTWTWDNVAHAIGVVMKEGKNQSYGGR